MLNRFIDRDVERKVMVAGALLARCSLMVNGEIVHNQPGQFRKPVPIKPGMNIITVVSR